MLALDDLGLHEGMGEQRTVCIYCGGRRKNLGVNTDTGTYHCFRCGAKGRIGQTGNWLADQIERIKKSQSTRQTRHEKAAENARAFWNRSQRCLWHGYLKRKGVLPLGVRQSGSLLVVPMYDTSGRLWNVQTIDQQGNKLFLRGGRATACYFPIQGSTREIFIVEGFATGAALHMYYRKRCRVAVAFNCGNLVHVALALREKHPATPLIIAADDDRWTAGNPGLTKGREAATAASARLIYPNFDGLDVSGEPTDFCDLHLLEREVVHGRG